MDKEFYKAFRTIFGETTYVAEKNGQAVPAALGEDGRLIPVPDEIVMREIMRLEAALHANRCHPDYEYDVTEEPRKMGGYLEPEGEGWVINRHFRDGFERFDFHEERYWMRRKP